MGHAIVRALCVWKSEMREHHSRTIHVERTCRELKALDKGRPRFAVYRQ